MIALIPFFTTLLVCLGTCFFILKRKSLAQAICVQQASRIQHELSKPLTNLLRLNPRATTLRAQRQAADLALDSAIASGYPPAIAAAKAVQVAVILQQTALRTQQLALLMEAQRIRDQGQRDLRGRATALEATHIQAQTFYYRPLAVEPRPKISITPNYETIRFFEIGQQQRFRFAINLLGRSSQVLGFGFNPEQTTECSVTLKGQEEQWNLHILAAKAP